MAYAEWGAAAATETLICVHGLTRNSGDFDRLSGALEDRARILCPDVVGRGRSGRLAEGTAYGVPQYVTDMTVMLAAAGVEDVLWVGTSMGGLIGMAMAAMPGTPIKRMVLNDVGPFIPKSALERIGTYLAMDPVFDTWEAGAAHIREIYAPFGRLSEADWNHLCRNSLEQDDEGRWRQAYDPAIAVPFKTEPVEDVDLWPMYEAIQCPVLVLRGADSDLLLPETTAEMAKRGPRATVVEFDDCGHAPSLMTAEQIATVRSWLFD